MENFLFVSYSICYQITLQHSQQHLNGIYSIYLCKYVYKYYETLYMYIYNI